MIDAMYHCGRCSLTKIVPQMYIPPKQAIRFEPEREDLLQRCHQACLPAQQHRQVTATFAIRFEKVFHNGINRVSCI